MFTLSALIFKAVPATCWKMFKLNLDGDMLSFLSPAGRQRLSICLPSALADLSYFPSAKRLVST